MLTAPASNRIKLKTRTDRKEVMKKVLSKVDCLACGRCCTSPGGMHSVRVSRNDEHHDMLYNVAVNIPGAVVEYKATYDLSINAEKQCAFLSVENEKNYCAVYDFRPATCKAFPFMMDFVSIEEDHGISLDVDAVILSRCCPPVNELFENGINFLCLLDILKQKPEIPLVGNAMTNLFDLIEKAVLFERHHLFEYKGSVIFPIV